MGDSGLGSRYPRIAEKDRAAVVSDRWRPVQESAPRRRAACRRAGRRRVHKPARTGAYQIARWNVAGRRAVRAIGLAPDVVTPRWRTGLRSEAGCIGDRIHDMPELVRSQLWKHRQGEYFSRSPPGLRVIRRDVAKTSVRVQERQGDGIVDAGADAV